MTTKITQIAMFALAAFALTGMMTSPAFADYTFDKTNNASLGSTDTYNYIKSSACGTKVIFTSLEIAESDPGSEDSVTVDYDASRCNTFNDVTITVYVDGDFYGTFFSSSSSSGNVAFGGNSISGGDPVRVVIDYDVA